MIGASVSDAFKAIELALKALNYRSVRGRKIFEDHVEPCFKSLSEIHTDYLKSLHDLETRLPTPAEYEELQSLWRANSINTASSRARLKAIAKEWAENTAAHTPAEVGEFFSSVDRYFDMLADPKNQIGRSLYSLIKDAFRVQANEGFSRIAFARLIDRLRRDLDERWSSVSASYAKSMKVLLR